MIGEVTVVLREKAEQVIQEGKFIAQSAFWTGYELTNDFAASISKTLKNTDSITMKGQAGGAGAIVTMVAGVGVTIGFVLLFLAQFQKSIDNTSAAYTALGDIVTQIQNNVVWIGLILLAGLGGVAYAIAKSMGLLG